MARGGSRRLSRLVLSTALLTVVNLLAVSPPARAALTFTVDSTGDAGDASTADPACNDGTGHCTLRAAIQQTNVSGSATEPTQIRFALPAFPFRITVGSSNMTPAVRPVDIDGTTQPGFAGSPIVELQGPGEFAGPNGLDIRGGNSRVRGLVVNKLNNGIVLSSNGNRIEGNFLGTDPSGTIAMENVWGIRIFSPWTNNVVGGLTPADRNLISGNSRGIEINGPDNVVQGNLFGTTVSGSAPLFNTTDLLISGPRTLVGGTIPAARNVIARFMSITSPGADSVVQGNYIGSNATGTVGFATTTAHGIQSNAPRVIFGGTQGVTPGGPCSGACNLISSGLLLGSAGQSVVQGNYIGTDVAGLTALHPNLTRNGITICSFDNLIGGDTPEERNLISGNGGNGVSTCNTATRNRIEGNFIGTDRTGASPLPNKFSGVVCCPWDGDNVTIGNVIAFNGQSGVLIVGDGRIDQVSPVIGTRGNAILGNSIFANGGLGIELCRSLATTCNGDGPNPNDEDDADIGPNGNQNFPVIRNVTVSPSTTTIDGTLNSVPSRDYHLEFFRNSACDSSRHGEGQTFLGERTVTTDSGGDASFAFNFPFSLGTTEVITSTATDPENNTSEFSECLADLSITKTDSPDPVAPNGTLTYTLDVANAGPAPVGAAKVVDTLPAGVTFLSATPSQGTCSFASGKVTCLLGAISRLETAQILIQVKPNAPGTITNTATVSSELNDPDPSDNTDTEETTVQTVTGTTLSVVKTADGASVTAGNPIGFTVTVTNTGQTTATGVTMTDSLPGGSGIDWSESPENPSCSIGGSPPSETLTCSFGDLAPGASSSVHVSSGTTSSTSGSFPNTATAQAGNAPSASGSASVTVTSQAPSLSMSKTADAATVTAGGQIGYTIAITNAGPGSATGVSLTDQLPGGTGLDWSLSPGVAGCSISGSPPSETLSCSFASLPPGTTTIHVTSPTTTASCGTYSNTANLMAQNHPNVSSNSSTITVTCAGAPVLNVSKSACPQTATTGGLLTYTISFANTGTTSATGATLVDTIPSGTTVNNAGGGKTSAGKVTWKLGTLAAGQSGSKTLILLVNAPVGATLTNKVTLSASNAVPATATTQTPVSNAGAITHGSAYGVDVLALGVHLIDRAGLVASEAPGSPQQDADQVANVSLPGVVTVGAASQASASSITSQAKSTASSTITAVNLLNGAVTADLVKGVSESIAGSTSSSTNSTGSTLVNLKINGNAIQDVAPNSSFQVKDPQDPNRIIASIVIYEQTSTTSTTGGVSKVTHSVNMIHLTLLKPLSSLPQGAEIVLAHAETDAAWPISQSCGG